MPDGTGLPVGKGSVSDGDELYEEQCAVCHGDFGAGGLGYPTLTGGDISSLTNQRAMEYGGSKEDIWGPYWPQGSKRLRGYSLEGMAKGYTKEFKVGVGTYCD